MEKLINEFSFGLFFWQSLIFIGLILLLRKFAWKPILDAVNERETSIKDAINAASGSISEDLAQANADAQQALADAQKALDESRKDPNRDRSGESCSSGGGTC